MNKLRYQIESTTDRDGNKKDIPNEWKLRQYFIHSMLEGRSAFLIDENEKVLQTSVVEQIFLWENGIQLTTMNTVYYLRPYLVGENSEGIRLL